MSDCEECYMGKTNLMGGRCENVIYCATEESIRSANP